MMLEGASYLLTLLAWLALEQDELEKAEALITESLTRADAEQHKLARVSGLLIRARLAARQERWAEAEAAASQALDLCRAMPYPYGEARALYTAGMNLARQGKASSARKRLDEARGILTGLGERLYGQRIEQALKTLPR